MYQVAKTWQVIIRFCVARTNKKAGQLREENEQESDGMEHYKGAERVKQTGRITHSEVAM